MSNIKLITVTNQPERAETLVRTAQLHGWDIVVIQLQQWRGFGEKLISVYNYLKEHPEVERFVFADAHDVVVMGTEEEFEEKIGFLDVCLSAERGLWPPILNPLVNQYANYTQYNGFNYPNSGLYYAKSSQFIKLINDYPVEYHTDDQFWMNLVSIVESYNYELGDGVGFRVDHRQSIFNSHSFISEGEYTYENGRVQIMGNQPLFIHSNGGTKDEKLDKLVKEMLG